LRVVEKFVTLFVAFSKNDKCETPKVWEIIAVPVTFSGFVCANFLARIFKIALKAGRIYKQRQRYKYEKPIKTQKSWEKKQKVSNCGILF
jgi:hypothetical protein